MTSWSAGFLHATTINLVLTSHSPYREPQALTVRQVLFWSDLQSWPTVHEPKNKFKKRKKRTEFETGFSTLTSVLSWRTNAPQNNFTNLIICKINSSYMCLHSVFISIQIHLQNLKVNLIDLPPLISACSFPPCCSCQCCSLSKLPLMSWDETAAMAEEQQRAQLNTCFVLLQ